MVGRAGKPDHRGPAVLGQLHRQRADATGGAGDDNGIAGLHADRGDGGIGRRAHDVKSAGHLPGDVARFGNEIGGLDEHVIGMAGLVFGEADNVLPHGEPVDSLAELDDLPGQVESLTGGKSRREHLLHRPAADRGLQRVDARGFHRNQNLPGPRGRPRHVDDLQHLDIAVLVESHCTRHAGLPH